MVRRNPLVMFMCIELMLNAVNLTFVALARDLGDISGQTAVLFVMVVAARGGRRRPRDRRVDPAPPPERDRRRPHRAEGLSVLDVVWLIPALPLAGFLLILLFGRRLGEPGAGYLATLMVGGSFAVTVGVLIDLLSKSPEERSHVETLFSWVPVGSLKVDLAFLADPLSITMCLFVTGISSLIHMYAVGYMHGDQRFSKFFLYLNLFVLSMLLLVLGENLLVTFLGWEASAPARTS
jgi:hypothetical protein